MITAEADFYLQRLGIKDATVSRITHESAMVATVYKVEQPDRDPLILKICALPRHYYRELTALKLLADKPFAPHVKETIPPEGNIRGALLMEYLSGALLTEMTVTETLAYELGSTLAHIHDIRSEEGEEAPLQYFTRKFEEGINECAHQLSPSLLRRCRIYFAQHVNLLHVADGSCMVHGDFHPGNIIVSNGRIRGVVDWSSMHSGFAEEDLCPLESSQWNWSVKSKDAFLRGYRSIRPVPEFHKVISLFQLSKTLAVIGFTIRTGTWVTDNAEAYKSNLQRLESLLC